MAAWNETDNQLDVARYLSKALGDKSILADVKEARASGMYEKATRIIRKAWDKYLVD